MEIPADAFAKANEKVAAGKDFYSDLTDEEREEEGLPPREAAKPDEKPAAEAAATNPDPEPDPDPDDDEKAPDSGDLLLQEIQALRGELSDALEAAGGEGDPEGAAEEPDALLKHEDPTVRAMAERLVKLERAEEKRVIDAQLERDNAEFSQVMQSYQIGGKPMTVAHKQQVQRYMLENPAAGAVLTMEEATLRVFPQAVKVNRPKSSPAKSPGDSKSGKSAGVATIVDATASGGAPSGPWKPRDNETIESAVEAFGRSRGWIR